MLSTFSYTIEWKKKEYKQDNIWYTKKGFHF